VLVRGGVARPQLTGDRPAVFIEYRPDHQLLELWAVILAVAALTHCLAAFALEVDRGGVKEHQLQLAEQVPVTREQRLLNPVLGAARAKGRGSLLIRQRLAQPGHRAVEVVQLKLLHTGDGIVLAPAFSSPVRARREQSMQHGKEDRPFHGELELAMSEQLVDHALTPALTPQPLEHLHCPDAP
jgi:hypothetical protein